MGSEFAGCCQQVKGEEKAIYVPIKEAIRGTDMKSLIKYLRQEGDNFGYDQTSDESTGDTVLHELMRRKDLAVEVYEYLLYLKHIDWNITNKLGQTPIDAIPHESVRNNMLLRVEFHRKGGNIQVRPGDDPLAEITSSNDQNEYDEEIKIQESGTATPSARTPIKKLPAPVKIKKTAFNNNDFSDQSGTPIARTPLSQFQSPLILKRVTSIIEPLDGQQRPVTPMKNEQKILISDVKKTNDLSFSSKFSVDWENQALLLSTTKK